MNERRALTASGLISELQRLAPDTIIRWSEHDSEYMLSHIYAVSGVASDGFLRHGHILATEDDFPEDREEEDG